MTYLLSRHLSTRAIYNPAFYQRQFTFHTSTTRQQSYFDTFKFVERLEKEGFTIQQSEVIMVSLQKVITESMRDLTKMMVSKAEREKAIYAYKVDFAKLKSEVTLIERNDFTIMKAENDRLEGELAKLKQRLREEITRTQANVRLDLNLEKGRVRDEASAQEIKIKETDTRIESEISGLRTQMEAVKFQIMQYMIGTMTGAGALFLAYLRMFK
ncbi:mitochondrion protein [Thamnidium elegans]|nr:mitochondrion protein [Thamnidium elegans]